MKTKATAKTEPEKVQSHPLISNEKFRALYTAMLKCRMLSEQTALSVTLPSTAGEEAVAAALTTELRKEDVLLATHRDYAAAWLKGAPLKTILQEFSQSRNAIQGGYAPQHILKPYDSNPESIELFLKAVKANKTKKKEAIGLAFVPSTEVFSGPWHAALQTAAKADLPILFVAKNTLLIHNGKKAGKAEALSVKAQEYGLPAIPVDGHDVVAVYRVTQECLSRARRDSQPAFIECVPFACEGAVSTTRMKSTQKTAVPALKDPVLNMEKYLQNRGLFSEELKQQPLASFQKELAKLSV